MTRWLIVVLALVQSTVFAVNGVWNGEDDLSSDPSPPRQALNVLDLAAPPQPDRGPINVLDDPPISPGRQQVFVDDQHYPGKDVYPRKDPDPETDRYYPERDHYYPEADQFCPEKGPYSPDNRGYPSPPRQTGQYDPVWRGLPPPVNGAAPPPDMQRRGDGGPGQHDPGDGRQGRDGHATWHAKPDGPRRWESDPGGRRPVVIRENVDRMMVNVEDDDDVPARDLWQEEEEELHSNELTTSGPDWQPHRANYPAVITIDKGAPLWKTQSIVL